MNKNEFDRAFTGRVEGFILYSDTMMIDATAVSYAQANGTDIDVVVHGHFVKLPINNSKAAKIVINWFVRCANSINQHDYPERLAPALFEDIPSESGNKSD